MKTIIKTVWFMLILAVSAGAANYTVKSGGGGSYTTIQACATAMSAGDTCTVYAGTYHENVTVSAGSAGNYKTLTVNSSDTVYVYSFTINSHVKVNGFSIQNPSSPNSAPCVSITGNSTDYYITNNNMYACSTFVNEATNANTTHGFIQGNTMSYACSTSSAPNVCRAMTINGDYHLIENNDISHVSDGPYVFGAHNVLRKNTFHDVNSNDCGSLSSNCHIDFMQADSDIPGSLPATYLLIESNTVLNMVGTNMHALGILQAESCNGQCFGAIVRFHVAGHFGSGGIIDDNSGSSSPGWSNVKAYNNSWIDANNQTGGAGNATSGFTHNSTGGSQINNLFYYAQSLSDFNPYFTDSSTVATFTVANNLAYCTGSPCNLRSKYYGSGKFTDDPGNQVADPKFVNYAANDFDLAAGSPAIGAGTNLTTVGTGDTGSGSSIVLNDASFFQDGAGIAGVNADCIAVGTVTNHVCVTAINYQTQTLTLASSISRSVGDPVWLISDSTGRTVLTGSAPNIGATFVSLSPPTNLTAAVH